MSGSRSRRKGKKGEREFARRLTSEGFSARRGRQYAGHPDAPDVLCPDLPDLHWEVKRVERFHLYDSLAQAISESGERIPVVAHRKNRCEWVVVLRLEDFLGIVRESELVATEES